MNLFEIVKYGVSCREAAERYGVEVNHYGMALCPFHNDRHPSLYVADDHYHCFACGEHGDVIDFVSKLFHLSLYDAAQKLAADFHLMKPIQDGATITHRSPCLPTGSVPSLHKMSGFTTWRPPTMSMLAASGCVALWALRW